MSTPDTTPRRRDVLIEVRVIDQTTGDIFRHEALRRGASMEGAQDLVRSTAEVLAEGLPEMWRSHGMRCIGTQTPVEEGDRPCGA